MNDDVDDLLDDLFASDPDSSGCNDALVTPPAVSRQNPTISSTLQSDVPDGELFQEVQREGYRWATDCFWVYKRIGAKLTKAEAGPGRWALWQEAKRDLSNFVGQILPKAMTLLEKARDKAGDTGAVEKVERKEIGKLQEILIAAREEAAEMAAAGTL